MDSPEPVEIIDEASRCQHHQEDDHNLHNESEYGGDVPPVIPHPDRQHHRDGAKVHRSGREVIKEYARDHHRRQHSHEHRHPTEHRHRCSLKLACVRIVNNVVPDRIPQHKRVD